MCNAREYLGFSSLLLLISFICGGKLLAQKSDVEFYYGTAQFELNETKLFSGTQVNSVGVYVDTTGSLTFSDIVSYTKDWQKAEEVVPQRDIVYWLHSRMLGSEQFKGKQVFHVGQELGNDLHAYDFIDFYTINQNGESSHARTGKLIKQADKPIQFWANLNKLEIQDNDTLDVFIRLEGFNLNYSLEHFKVWHLDYDTLLSTQISAAIKSSVFYGILGIQILFFIFLFLIEKERIYFYFSLFGSGLFLSRAFSEFNFSSFVPFPSLIPYNEILFHSSVYISLLGGILFVSKYLNIPKDGLFMRRVVPVYLVLTLIAYGRFLFRYSFTDEGTYPPLLTPAYYTLSALLLGIYMFVTAPKSKITSRLLLLIAIIPIIIGTFLTITFNEGWLPNFFNASLVDDIMKLAVIFLVVTLALIVGYRSNLLKSEKNEVIQENLKAQQTIFENQMRTEQLEEMDQLKTRLYTNITHEFRTPLTVIMGINNELLETNQKLNIAETKKDKIFQNQQLIQRNSQNLLNLVNQLLGLSKADNQQLELQLVQGDIIPFLNYLTESFYSKAKEKNIRLVFYTELRNLIMDYDEQKMQHIVYNLLSNALKFTAENGKIVMHASLMEGGDDKALQIKVSDTGIGISQEKLPHIFDRFYQVDDSQTRHHEGSGIGLSLTKEIVKLMDGQISVESMKEEGTVFTVLLPVKTTAAIQTKPKDYHLPKTLASSDKELLSNEIKVLAFDDKPSVLIVEDNKDVSNYLKQILENTYQITEVINGEVGISTAIETIPDLIISDVMMPIKDGYQLTETLKKDRRTSHIPIILLTAKATQGDKVEGLKQGADAYLHKPFDKEELLIRVQRLLENRLALRKHYTAKYSSDPTEKQSQLPKHEEREEQFLDQLNEIILKDIKNSRLNLDCLSKKLGISQSQLYRKLKALTGDTPNTFIRNIRLHKSLLLLQETELNISEIGYEVGFTNPSYFSKSFNKKYGKSPLYYRKLSESGFLGF